MACPCCSTLPCPVCAYTCAIDGSLFEENRGPSYYARFQGLIEEVPGCPFALGFSGSNRGQSLWMCCPLPRPSRFVPPANVPAFNWNAGYPANLSSCLSYFMLDTAEAKIFGEGCCAYNSLDGLNCNNRDTVCAARGKFRWRLLVVDCEQESLIDITTQALTPIGVFEGTYNQLTTPIDRDCQSIVSTALPDYFNDPTVVCNN